MDYFAGVDSIAFGLVCKTEEGRLTDVSEATITIRKSRSINQRDWEVGTEVLAVTPMVNTGQGRYRYLWPTTDVSAGKYVAQVTVYKDGVYNTERRLFTLV